MSIPVPAGLRRSATISIAIGAITAMTVASATNAQAAPAPTRAEGESFYIVQFDGAPIAGYAGGVASIAATRPVGGARLDTRSWNYAAYRKHLQDRRSAVLRTANIAKNKTVREYNNVLNGVAVKLTSTEALKLRGTKGVANVWKDRIFKIQTADTPKFLGLDGEGGVWEKQFGGVENAGEGVVVGVIDTGVTPESASFAALPEPRPDADAIAAKWQGTCEAGDEAPVECNNKLIGARWYDFGSFNISDKDFLSPRDWNGHGTHTASTAAGNNNVAATVNGEPVGNISGMAPAARVAAYKVCWEATNDQGEDAGGCGTKESLAAIDDAISDGVDVINYSIGGSPGAIAEPVELAFMHAAAAGVFVAASAGNTAGASEADHNSPWLTTVAASTHDRTFEKTVTLGDGTTFTGPGNGGALPATPLVDSVAVAAATDENGLAAARLCALDSLDPAKVAGKIVVCQRGVVARTEKSRSVKNAGGVGMIQYNATPNSLNADFHAVPSIHVDTETGDKIKAYAATEGATASFTAAVRKKAKAPVMASFSSSGPARATAGDLLKPDITAPGSDVIAAVAPPGNFGNEFDAYSGTSMSSPHIAGLAALMKGKNPTWSPGAIKSAMMTTATTVDNSGAPIGREGSDEPSTPLDYGAGHVRPAAAYNPGLVYDSGPLDWYQFICGIGENFSLGDPESPEFIEDGCSLTGKIDPSNLNYPSIAVGDLAGKQTVTRTVTNTTNQASIYLPKVQTPPGYAVKVTPPVLTVLPRKSAQFKVEFTRTNAAYGEFSFGSITWSDLRGHSVRSPIALRSTPVTAPAEISGTGASGKQAITVTPGFNGTLTAKVDGLVASKVASKQLVGENQGFDQFNPAEGPSVLKTTITIPQDALAARVATIGSQYPEGTDLDLYVHIPGDPSTDEDDLFGVSGTSGSDESIDLPPGVTADVYVVQFSTPAPNDTQDVHLHSWVVPAGPAGNLTVTPASQSASMAKPATVTANWTGLTPGEHYLGVIEYGEGPNVRGGTIITVHA